MGSAPPARALTSAASPNGEAAPESGTSSGGPSGDRAGGPGEAPSVVGDTGASRPVPSGILSGASGRPSRAHRRRRRTRERRLGAGGRRSRGGRGSPGRPTRRTKPARRWPSPRARRGRHRAPRHRPPEARGRERDVRPELRVVPVGLLQAEAVHLRLRGGDRGAPRGGGVCQLGDDDVTRGAEPSDRGARREGLAGRDERERADPAEILVPPAGADVNDGHVEVLDFRQLQAREPDAGLGKEPRPRPPERRLRAGDRREEVPGRGRRDGRGRGSGTRRDRRPRARGERDRESERGRGPCAHESSPQKTGPNSPSRMRGRRSPPSKTRSTNAGRTSGCVSGT